MRLYEEGYKLGEDEYLMKVREEEECTWKGNDRVWRKNGEKTAFLTKLTQKGEIPKSFNEWFQHMYRNAQEKHEEPPIQVVTETYRRGWSLHKWRFGQSQNWAVLKNPEGLFIEVYLTHFLDLVKMNTIIEGKIEGKFKWRDNTLIKEWL